jgi:hypothetical protein
MAENSLQNQKNEVSFVLSDKAKAIIEKFEDNIADLTENNKTELRIDLLMFLVRRLHPEVLSSDTKSIYVSLYRLNNYTIDKNNGFLMSCFAENEMNILCNEFKSIWNYYLPIVSIAGIATSDDYQELLLCFDVMPGEKRKIVLDYWWFSLYQSLDCHKSKLKEESIQDKALTELVTDLNTLFSGLDLTFDTFLVSHRSRSVSISNIDSFAEFVAKNVNENGAVFVLDSPTELNKDVYLQFRKWAVDSKFLYGVIEMDDLPSYDAQTQVLVLKKQLTDSVFFARIEGPMDGSGPSVKEIKKVLDEKNPDHYKVVSLEDFKAHNNRYYTFIQRQFVPTIIANEGETIVTLGNLVDLYESEVEEDVSCYFLNRAYYITTDLWENLETVTMPRARRVPNDKFFLFRWDEFAYDFSCAYQSKIDDGLFIDGDSSTGVERPYDYYTQEPIICTYPNSIIFKLKETPAVPIDPYYLAKLLFSSREVYAQLDGYKLPYSDCVLEKEDFLSILVAIPTMEEQQRILNLDRQKALAETREEIQKNFESYKKDIRMKKHAMAQRLGTMKNCWKKLLEARKDGNGIVNDEATVGYLHPVSVKNIYTQIEHEINMLSKQLSSFTLGDVMDGKEVFDAAAFVREYIKHHDPMFEYQCDELPDKPANIRFPHEAFQIIMDNIASNACTHGFKGKETGENIIRVIMEIKGYDLIVHVSNNGKPMPVKMTPEKVFTYGDTTEEGVGEHSGLGGYQIKDLMAKFGGEVELLLDAEAEFPVTYKLVFRDVNIYK